MGPEAVLGLPRLRWDSMGSLPALSARTERVGWPGDSVGWGGVGKRQLMKPPTCVVRAAVVNLSHFFSLSGEFYSSVRVCNSLHHPHPPIPPPIRVEKRVTETGRVDHVTRYQRWASVEEEDWSRICAVVAAL